MKIGATLSFLFSIQVLAQPAWALSQITYSAPANDQSSKLTGELPLRRVGSLLLPDGVGQFNTDELRIMAVPDWLFDRETVLAGPIIRAQIVKTPTSSTMSGLVFFLAGSWLGNLGSLRAPDVIATISGEQIIGRVVSRQDQTLAVQLSSGGTRRVNFSDIQSITSPRAFTFNVPAQSSTAVNDALIFQASELNLAPSGLNGHLLASRKASVPASNLPGTDPGISNRSIAQFVALDVFVSDIIPAVSIPLVLNKRNQRAALNAIQKALNAQTAPSAASSPAASTASTSSLGGM